MTTQPFTSSALDQIAEHLVSDRNTHRVLDRKFAELGIPELRPEPSEASLQQEESWKAKGLKRGVHYEYFQPSKREKLRYALNVQSQRSGPKGVLHLIGALNEPVSYSHNLEEFKTFSNGINRILRFHGVEYRDDGKFHYVDTTRTLSEADQRAKTLENKISSRRIHPEVYKSCRAEFLQEDYFHAVEEAYKGLAEQIRQKTGLTHDGVQLMRLAFERPSSSQGGLPKFAFNTLQTTTEQNEHDGFLDLLIGCTKLFRNPMSHTPKVIWNREVDDTADGLTLISMLNYQFDKCHSTSPPKP